MTGTTSAAYGGSHECPGRPRRCSAGEYVPRAPSTSPPLGWAPPCAWSSPQRLAHSNDPDSAEELVTELRRASVDLIGSKSLSAFAETGITTALSTRSQSQRFRRRGDGDERTGARGLCKRRRGWGVHGHISLQQVFGFVGFEENTLAKTALIP